MAEQLPSLPILCTSWGTTAKSSGWRPALTAKEARKQLGKVESIINGGKRPSNKESTIVDVTRNSPVILRQGIMPVHEIDKAYKEYSEQESEAHCHRL